MTPPQLTRAQIKALLLDGKAIPEQMYVQNLRTHHRKTFYYYLQLLTQKPRGSRLSARLFRQFILAHLRAAGIAVPDDLNPDGWFSRSWTERTQHPEYFLPAYELILERDDKAKPYTYRIRAEFHTIIHSLIDEIAGMNSAQPRSNLTGATSSPARQTRPVSMGGGDDIGKTTSTLRCALTGQNRPDTHEERVRQDFLLQLLDRYGYQKQDIAFEFTVGYGGEGVQRADIVIFYSGMTGTRTGVFAVIECKRRGLGRAAYQAAQQQLYGYLKGCPNLRFAALVGDEVEVWKHASVTEQAIYQPVAEFPLRSQMPLLGPVDPHVERTNEDLPAKEQSTPNHSIVPQGAVTGWFPSPSLSPSPTQSAESHYEPIVWDTPASDTPIGLQKSTATKESSAEPSLVNEIAGEANKAQIETQVDPITGKVVLLILLALVVGSGWLLWHFVGPANIGSFFGGVALAFMITRLVQWLLGRGCATFVLILFVPAAMISPAVSAIISLLTLPNPGQMPMMIGVGVYAVGELLFVLSTKGTA